MTSFSQRFTHPVDGHLESISADVVDDGRGVPPYYRAIIRLDETSREHLLHGVELTSGMPALAMIGVGEETLLTYLMEPLWRSCADCLSEPCCLHTLRAEPILPPAGGSPGSSTFLRIWAQP